MSELERARLIPVSGIKGQTEAEDRATSALLAVLSVVRPFSVALLGPLGATRAKSARVEAFLQPVVEADDGTVRPDGLIRVSVGKRVSHEAFVETKTGTAKLDAAQINAYLDAARAAGVDAIVTISNEIAPAPGVHPTEGLRVRSNSKVAVHHLSWMLIVSEAVKEHARRGVDDPEQAWILEELIRFMSHPNSGVLDFADMGDNWTGVRDAAVDGSLARNSPETVEVCQRWDQLLRVAALRLGTEIGSDVTEVIPRAHQQNPRLRNKEFVQSLCTSGTLTGVLRVPDAISDLSVTADIKTSRVIVSAAFVAPTDCTPRASVVWLTKQLKAANGSLLVDARARNAKHPVTASLEQLREDPRNGLGPAKQTPARFLLRYSAPMGQGRRSTRKKGFIDSVLDAVIGFYGDVMQDLKPFVPSAPAIDRRNIPASAADTSNSPPRSSGGADAATESMRDLLNERFIDPGAVITMVHQGVDHLATITSCGEIEFNGGRHTSPSTAAEHVTGRSTNGWQAWRLADGSPLADLRWRLRARRFPGENHSYSGSTASEKRRVIGRWVEHALSLGIDPSARDRAAVDAFLGVGNYAESTIDSYERHMDQWFEQYGQSSQE